MKNNHIATAVKALKRQRNKYQEELDRFDEAEHSARQSKEFFQDELAKLDEQIADLEKSLPKQLEIN